MPKIEPDDKSNARSVRLALGADIVKTVGDKALGPAVRLAVAPVSGATGANSAEHHVGKGGLGPAPSIRLAHVPGAQGDNNLLGQRGVEALPEGTRPALLVSYVYLPPFLENKHRYCYRDWALDSGAFSAHNSGMEIKLQDYIDCCKTLVGEDRTLTEVFALDVIGSWKDSIKNAEEMWKQGVEAIPTFHYGEPWDVLKGIAKDYPKIAVGGCVGKRDKDKFASQCFARVWPKKIHGFGFGSEKSIMLLPFHSVDATNWEIGPCKYGRWNAFGGHCSVRGSEQNLRAEVEWYLDLEKRARERWKKEMARLEALGPSIRMAVIGARDKNDNSPFLKEQPCGEKALGPAVRLAIEPNAGGLVDGEKRALRTFKKRTEK